MIKVWLKLDLSRQYWAILLWCTLASHWPCRYRPAYMRRGKALWGTTENGIWCQERSGAFAKCIKNSKRPLSPLNPLPLPSTSNSSPWSFPRTLQSTCLYTIPVLLVLVRQVLVWVLPSGLLNLSRPRPLGLAPSTRSLVRLNETQSISTLLVASKNLPPVCLWSAVRTSLGHWTRCPILAKTSAPLATAGRKTAQNTKTLCVYAIIIRLQTHNLNRFWFFSMLSSSFALLISIRLLLLLKSLSSILTWTKIQTFLLHLCRRRCSRRLTFHLLELCSTRKIRASLRTTRLIACLWPLLPPCYLINKLRLSNCLTA